MEGRDRQLIPLPFSSYDDHPNALTTMTVAVVRKVRREVWGAAHPRKPVSGGRIHEMAPNSQRNTPSLLGGDTLLKRELKIDTTTPKQQAA